VTTPAPDTVALVLVGDELLTGHTGDTNGRWLGRRLTAEGLRVVSATVVPDDVDTIVLAVQRGLTDARVVVVTGGLGPTDDDVTRAALARLAGGRPAVKLPNGVGSEPGARVVRDRGVVYAVPGVPAEMRSMVEQHVLGELVSAAGATSPVATHSLVVVGMAEARIAELLASVGAQLAGQGGLAFLPQPAEVEVRIVASGHAAEAVALAAAAQARALLGEAVAAENQRLEEAVVHAVQARHATVATAESLTGGLVAAALVSVPGASTVLRGGVVAYATDLKAELLDLPTGLLERDGAVAPSTAAGMAAGARARCRADFGVATTGVAGPDSQEGHPAGAMHVAVASAAGARVASFEPSGRRPDRETVRRLAVVRALDLLRRTVLDLGLGPGESPLASTR
jgi:nicotinamide-nucleotide amidase